MEWSHLIARDEQLHPTEAGNTHPLIPSGSRIVSVTCGMNPGSRCIPTRLHPTLLHPKAAPRDVGGDILFIQPMAAWGQQTLLSEAAY